MSIHTRLQFNVRSNLTKTLAPGTNILIMLSLPQPWLPIQHNDGTIDQSHHNEGFNNPQTNIYEKMKSTGTAFDAETRTALSVE